MKSVQILLMMACAGTLWACEAETPTTLDPAEGPTAGSTAGDGAGAVDAPAAAAADNGANSANGSNDAHAQFAPSQGLATRVRALSLPSAEAEAANGDAAAADSGSGGECVAWNAPTETYNGMTGEFSSVSACPEGGDIAEVRTEGRDEGGHGSYTTTYVMRDGSEIAWEFDFVNSADGATQTLSGSSGDETLEATYTMDAEGGYDQHEVWGVEGGEYLVDGHTTAQGVFSGTMSFDDPSTEASPDYTATSQPGDDGSLTQVVSGVSEGWAYSYTLVTDAAGNSGYDFESDAPATAASPDYAGHYDWSVDGVGNGHYTQLLDDGSTVIVSDVYDAAGNVDESWSFDDLATERNPDQEGTVHYTPDGHGVGELRTHLEDGSVETCAMEIHVDGTTDVTNCR